MPKRLPRLAVVADHRLEPEDRASRVALAAARDGWEVLLLASSSASTSHRSQLGEVRVLRVPIGKDMTKAEARRRAGGTAALQPLAGLPNGRAIWDAEYRSRSRSRSATIGQLKASGSAADRASSLALQGFSLLDRMTHDVRARMSAWDLSRLPDPEEPVGDWRRDLPRPLDVDLALGPHLERYRPDVIHACGVRGLYPAVIAATRLRRRGQAVRVVYDSTDYVPGLASPSARARSAYPQLEAECIRLVDGVVAMSPDIAEALVRDHGLTDTPTVVRDVPAGLGDVASHLLQPRAALQIDDSAPLLVSIGPVLGKGCLDNAVDALPMLPAVHLLIAAKSGNPVVARLQRRAINRGVGDRVHSLPPMGPSDEIDLRSASAAVIGAGRSVSEEMFLPSTLGEAIQHRLPVLTARTSALTSFLRDHHIGLAFDGDAPAERFAESARAVLDRQDELRSHITDALITEFSWEHQQQGLVSLYRSISAEEPAPRTDLALRSVEKAKTTRGKKASDSKGPRAADSVPWRTMTPDTPIRLGLGIANYAGQLAAYAQAVTASDPDVSAEVITRTMEWSHGYPSDVYVPGKDLGNLNTQLDLVRRVLPRYTHLLADAFLPIFGHLNGPDIAGDLPALAHHDIKTALLCHGSEIRNPRRHLERMPYSLFRFAPPERLGNLTSKVRRNEEILSRIDLPVFVTTPDLLADVPQALWVPVVVDVDAWSCDQPVMERTRPVVLHAPSARWSKGTDLFLPDLEELDSRGVIELKLAEGLPWSAMRELVFSADIVVDQVAVGSYGTFACEAMAAGKPVVVYLEDTVLQAVDGPLPLVNTAPTEVGATIERLLDERLAAAELGRTARDFARRMHDGRRSAAVLQDFLCS